jgi:hypothetical protein
MNLFTVFVVIVDVIYGLLIWFSLKAITKSTLCSGLLFVPAYIAGAVSVITILFNLPTWLVHPSAELGFVAELVLLAAPRHYYEETLKLVGI